MIRLLFLKVPWAIRMEKGLKRARLVVGTEPQSIFQFSWNGQGLELRARERGVQVPVPTLPILSELQLP